MKPKLILIEGLPGSGKTTTAKLVKEILIEKGVDCELFLEGNLNHPADLDGVAYFSESEWESLCVRFGQFSQMMHENVLKKEGGYLFPYKKLKNEEISTTLMDTCFENDIYELPLNENIKWITEKWNEFKCVADTKDKIYIFECCFIQNPVTMGMVKYDAPYETTFNYVLQLLKAVEGLDPILIYVEQEKIHDSFVKAIQERPREWSEGFISYYTDQGFGKKNDLHGLEGTLKILEERKKLELMIIDKLPMKKFFIDNSAFDRDKHKQRLSQILDGN
ncbi:P-loop NTPase family protein [Falsibacillus albus]|uniref:Adenylyl-sulfate kinase n=1 Tax=Falsibacillus albus TaxID=2478915 RepID=A0A3L7JZQ2_9BACI|nr:hypothetical protein [Falsibacillus albus]RLQ96263.1 hypothetical protein D9X91_08230 [Falsibacillus albus]